MTIESHTNRHPEARVWVTDVAAVTALGDTLTSTWRGLLAGETAIGVAQEGVQQRFGDTPLAVVDGLSQRGRHSAIRRLVPRVLDQLPVPPPGTRIITATTKAGIDNLERRKHGESVATEEILLADIGRFVAQYYQLSDQGINISAACASSTIALGQAAGWIADGQAEAVLVLGVDLVTEFVVHGFKALKALSPEPCRPFDRQRKGLSLGEGAAAMLLMSVDRVRRDSRCKLAGIAGWGAAGDATHMTAPDRRGRGLMRSVRGALAMAGLSPEAVGVVHAHGTGTVYNDAMELTVFKRIFGDSPIALYSVKGALGHTLGAAGIVEAAISIQGLAAQMVPPTTGCREPEASARAWIKHQPQKVAHDITLSTNSGFGGINAAVVLTRGETT
jgi:3-oxoacyl-[acyl-carrier-protein] synthase II